MSIAQTKTQTQATPIPFDVFFSDTPSKSNSNDESALESFVKWRCDTKKKMDYEYRNKDDEERVRKPEKDGSVLITGFESRASYTNMLKLIEDLDKQRDTTREIVCYGERFIVTPRQGDFIVWSSRKYPNKTHTLYVMGLSLENNTVDVARYDSNNIPRSQKELKSRLGRMWTLNIKKLACVVSCGTYAYNKYPQFS